MLKTASESVVYVEPFVAEGWASATGFYVDDRGTVLTARHVVADPTALAINVTAPADQGRRRPYVVDRNLGDAIAVLLVPESGHVASRPLRLARDTRLGQEVMVLGYGRTIFPGPVLTARWGRLAGVGPETGLAYVKEFVIDVPMAPGHSGSPVLDAAGAVVAFAEAGSYENPRMGYVVDLTDLKELR